MIRRAALVLLALTLTSCPGGTLQRRTKVPEKPFRGGVLNAELAEDVDFLDPQRAGQPAAVTIMRALHRGLMAFPAAEGDTAGTPVPDLAAGPPDISADGRMYTFTIRADVSFGPPASRVLTASDVRAGIERLLAPESVSPFAGYFHIIAGADAFAAGSAKSLSGVATPDDRTVVIRLGRPANDLLWILALPAAAAVPRGTRASAPPGAIAPSGPYMLAPGDGYVPEKSIHLIRNPSWQAQTDPVRPAYVDEIRISIGKTPSEIDAAVIAGGADMSLDEPPDLRALAANPLLRSRTHAVASGCLRYAWMNTRVKPFTDVRVRRAVASAIDKTPVLEAAGGQQAGVSTDSPLPRTVLGAVPTGSPSPTPSPSLDPAAARAALAAAGYPRGFTTQLVVGDRPVDVAQGRAIAASLEGAGVSARLRVVPIASVYVDGYELPAKKIPMGIATWCADWNGLAGRAMLTPLLDGRHIPPRGNNDYAMLNAPSLNRLLDAAAVTPVPMQQQAWAAAAAMVVRLAPWVPLVDLNEVSLVSERVASFLAIPLCPRGDLTAVSLRPSLQPSASPSASASAFPSVAAS
jgi:peptide/nickel transport system substrate-binding protein